MDHDVLRNVAQITIAYLQQNSVAGSDLPKLIELIGKAILEAHAKEQMPRPLSSDRISQIAGNPVVGLKSRPQSKPVGWVVPSPDEYRGKRAPRAGYRTVSPAGAAMRLTMEEHIGLVKRMLSDRERLDFSQSGSL
jgi:predicted transcriptional regulator